MLNGILWILRTGAPWKDLLDRYPPYQTCHRRFQKWANAGVMSSILERLARDLHQQGDIDLSECFIDGTFAPAKKGDLTSARRNGARVRNLWPSQTVLVFRSPLTHAVLADTRSSLLEALLKKGFSPIYQSDLVGDKAYDSDPLDSELAKLGIDMIAPQRKNRKKSKT